MKNRKAMLAASAFLAFCATTSLGLFDVYTGFYHGAGITFSSSFMTFVGFHQFRKNKGFRFFRFLMLSMMLLLPFEAQWIRGGFALSGSSMIWALSAPICGIMFHGPAKSVRWFAGYFFLLIFSGIMDPVFSGQALLKSQPPPARSTLQASQITESMNVITALKLPTEKNIRFRTLEMRDAQIRDVLRGLAQYPGIELNLMLAPDISGTIDFFLNDVAAEEVFNTILRTQNLAFSWDGNILQIFPATKTSASISRLGKLMESVSGPSSTLFFVTHIGGISLVIFLLFHYFVLRLRIEQERSESLLLNVLPSPIASRLKENQGVIADGFPEATILFADIAGFTQMSSSLSPRDVVEMLNRIFSAFDLLAEKFGLEKIKTIGDAYMVVGGIPSPSPDHARAIADMAIAMRDEISRLNGGGQSQLRIRIGINTGPVVAGVIGIKKFIYDLWGDAVNIASRMESTGKENFIQVTEATWEKLQDEFVLEKRGPVQVKGKGEMTTYFLIARKPISENG